jgi:hypothetical protein
MIVECELMSLTAGQLITVSIKFPNARNQLFILGRISAWRIQKSPELLSQPWMKHFMLSPHSQEFALTFRNLCDHDAIFHFKMI